MFVFSPDGITASGKLIEVKCPFKRKPTEEIPLHYKYQIQFLMHILRLPECDFIQYIPEGCHNKEVLIVSKETYNPHFFRAKFPLLLSFWQSVTEIRKAMENNVEITEEDLEKYDKDLHKPKKSRKTKEKKLCDENATIIHLLKKNKTTSN